MGRRVEMKQTKTAGFAFADNIILFVLACCLVGTMGAIAFFFVGQLVVPFFGEWAFLVRLCLVAATVAGGLLAALLVYRGLLYLTR